MLHRPNRVRFSDILLLKKKPKSPSLWRPPREFRRPTPWSYYKEDVLFDYHKYSPWAHVQLNDGDAGNFLRHDNLREINNRLWGWRKAKTITTILVTATDAFVKGKNLYVPPPSKAASPPPIDADAFKFTSTPVVSVTSRSARQKAWCSGWHVMDIYRSRRDFAAQLAYLRTAYAGSHLVCTFDKSLVVIVDGFCAGSGVFAFAGAPFVVTTNEASCEFPEAAYGFVPAGGAHFHLSKLRRGLGKYLACSGARISGADLYYCGLSSHHVAAENVPEIVEEIKAMPLLKTPPINALLERWTAKAELPPFSLQKHMPLIADAFGRRTVNETVEVLHDASKVSFDAEVRHWAAETAHILRSKSSLALHLIYALFERLEGAAAMPIIDAYELEFRAVCNLLKSHTLYEDISSRFLKDVPLNVRHVTPAQIDAMFSRCDFFVPLAFHTPFNGRNVPARRNRLPNDDEVAALLRHLTQQNAEVGCLRDALCGMLLPRPKLRECVEELVAAPSKTC